MAVVELDSRTLGETVDKGIVVIDFWASWCAPCRAFAPVFEAAATRHPDIVFAKVDTEAQPELAGVFQIRAIPSLGVFRDGVLLGVQPGALNAAALDALLDRVRALDMDTVRREVAAQERAAAPGPAGAA